MNFLADENIDRQIVARLRQDSHLVLYVAEMDPGISDEVVLELANREAVLLLTEDKDFGELVFRQHRLTYGVMLIRMAGLSPESKADAKLQSNAENSWQVVTPASTVPVLWCQELPPDADVSFPIATWYEIVSAAIREHAKELLQAFTVITSRNIRIRRW